MTVVVAAHDESPRIHRLISSLKEQDHPTFDVVLVDDRSTDGTLRKAREVAAGDSRFLFLRVDSRPHNWQGRLFAQDVGARAATGEWLIFLSGDQEITSPTFLRAMVAEYERGTDRAVSVVGRFGGTDWWHRYWFLPMFNNPVVWAAFFLLQRRGRSRWLIGALGLRRSTFESVGGALAAARCAAGGFDDWGWADLFEQKGVPARMAYHPALLDHSNWTSFSTFWDGLRRWLAGAFTYRRGGWWVAALLGSTMVLLLTGPLTLILDALRGLEPAAWAVALSGVGPAMGWGYVRWSGERGWFVLAFHFVAILLIGSLLGAAWARLRNEVAWRGDVMRIVAPSPPDGTELEE